jgi:hypothetical protein
MQIHLLRNGVKTGPFPLEEVQQMVKARRQSLSDYAWHQDWLIGFPFPAFFPAIYRVCPRLFHPPLPLL